MKTYAYTAKDMQGRTVKGSLQAKDSNDLLEKIHSRGLFCTGYNETKNVSLDVKFKFKTKDLAFLCRQLSSMLTSGLSLVKALDILVKEQENKRAREVLLEVYEDVQKGKALSAALEAQGGAFPEFLISMIGAGESSGTLDIVITRMSDHYAKENKLNNKIRSAMIYPIILLVLCVAVIIGLFTFIMPVFMGIFEDSEMPFLTMIMFSFSTFLTSKWYIVLAVVILAVILFRAYLSSQSGRLRFDSFKLTAPVFGKLFVKIYTGRFARTLSSLYSSGIPMVECLHRSAAVLDNTYISHQFVSVIEKVKQGESLSTSVAQADVFESMFCSILYVGEESGNLDEILIKTSDYYEDEADTAVQKMVTLIEPIMIIILGVIIGLVIASILPAMYGMFEDIQ